VANSQAVATSFKVDLLNGIHAFGVSVIRAATTADTFFGALYLASGSLGATTTAYSATSEVSGTGYTAGGQTVGAWNAPTSSTTIAFTTPTGNLVWTGLTLATAFDTVLIYNSTQSNKAVAVYTFGSQTITAGTLTLTMPSNVAASALLQLA
jgi:hypothetical protein